MPRKPEATMETLPAAVAESAAPAPQKRATPRKAAASAIRAKTAAAAPKKSTAPARASETPPKRAAKPKTSPKTSRAAKSNGTSPAAFDANTYRDDIARLAYRFWEQRGRVEGSPEEDWLRAEQEWRRTALMESA